MTTPPPSSNAIPAAVTNAYLTVGPGLGTTDRIRSPSPSARARPNTNVTTNAPIVNATVCRRGCERVATSSSPPINVGLMQSGRAIATTAR